MNLKQICDMHAIASVIIVSTCRQYFVAHFIIYNYFFLAEESMLMKARSFGGREMYRKAQSIEMPSCGRFENFKRDGHF